LDTLGDLFILVIDEFYIFLSDNEIEIMLGDDRL
jgi:hypothetical protein